MITAYRGRIQVTSDEKEMKGAQGKFIKRILYAILIFFVIAIVQWIIALVDETDNKVSGCFNCFVNGDCTAANVEE